MASLAGPWRCSKFSTSARVLKEACWINEVTFWKPNERQPEKIVRHGRVEHTEDGLSEFPHVVLNQARVHDIYLDCMSNAPSRLAPRYSRRVFDVEVNRGGTMVARSRSSRADRAVIKKILQHLDRHVEPAPPALPSDPSGVPRRNNHCRACTNPADGGSLPDARTPGGPNT